MIIFLICTLIIALASLFFVKENFKEARKSFKEFNDKHIDFSK
jgi:hypothetical protein